MLRKIVVHADQTPGSLIRVEIAAELAREHGGAAEAFVVSTLPQAPYGPGAVALSGAFDSMRATIVERNRAEAKAIADAVQAAHKIPTHVTETTADRIVIDVASWLRCVDLTVIAPPRAADASGDDAMFEAAVFGAGSPALLVPPTRDGAPVGRTVAIAWKDCREAARAIHDALPILHKAKTVRFVVVHGDKTYHGQRALNRMMDSLKGRGIAVGEPVIKSQESHQSEALLDAARSVGADLLVMGAYGRWRMSEMLFGGFTQHVLDHADIPVFLSH
jgi:nucleotide-binding universal stress UspA family protein